MTKDWEPWQDGMCYYTRGVCMAKCALACRCLSSRIIESRIEALDREQIERAIDEQER